MKNRWIIAMSALVIGFTSTLVACSSTPSGTAQNSSHLTIGTHVGPSGPESGLHLHPATETSMLPGPLRFLASYMQMQPGTTQVSMSISGYCPYTGNLDPGVERLIYGLGELVDSSCINSYLDHAPAQRYAGSPVVGSGTLSTLVVYTSTPAVSNTGLVVKVYDNNVATALTCTITTGNNNCKDLTDTATVNDGDYITATYTYDAAQAAAQGMSGIRVMLGKQ